MKKIMAGRFFTRTAFVFLFMEELGYIPYRDLKILSAEENEFYPVKDARQVNPLDPLGR